MIGEFAPRKYRVALIAIACSAAFTWAQPRPDPKPCGPTVVERLPRDVSVTAHRDRGMAQLHVQLAGVDMDLRVPGVMDGLVQACQSAADRLLVFGIASVLPLYDVYLIDPTRQVLIDWFYAFNPMLSPDKRWLMLRRFYPLSGVSPSEEYRLYDVTKDAPTNLISGGDPSGGDGVVGKLVYPVVNPVEEENGPTRNIDLPANQTHVFRSAAFYWAPDSKAVVFADYVQGALSIVLVTIGDRQPQAYVHAGPAHDPCFLDHTLVGAHFTKWQDGTYDVLADLGPGGPTCGPKSLTLAWGDFAPAKPRKPVEKEPKKPIIRMDPPVR